MGHRGLDTSIDSGLKWGTVLTERSKSR